MCAVLGKTLYVEPHILVEPTNELKRLLAQLREEENRIYLEMCLCIAKHLEAIVVSVRAVAEIDAFAAKANLGKALRGVIPEVTLRSRVFVAGRIEIYNFDMGFMYW